jgi:8-amino-7-oxononanoate synthase
MHRQRVRTEIQRLPDGYALKNRRRLANFSDNDYLGLSFDTRLRGAAEAALHEYGAGAGASRLVTGNHPLYAQLERELAEYKHTEDALVFGSGFLANLGVVNGLIPKEDIILADRLIHASLVDAMQLSGVQFQRYRHNDIAHLRQLLQKAKKRCWIITESVFSMDGDLAPLLEISALAAEFEAMLIVDDAHGMGVINNDLLLINRASARREAAGEAKRGGVSPSSNIIWVGTFSKAAGSYGGYVCASKTLIEQMVNKARSLIYTTGLPPSVVAANIAALKIIKEDTALTALPLQNARYFDASAQSAIVPVIIGDDEATLAAAQQLEEAGFLVSSIRPPTVPEGTSRLRITFSSVHKRAEIDRLRQTINEIMQ